MSKKIMCFGDSLTNGLMGSPYTEYIGVNYDVEKDGVDGRATTNMFAAVQEYFEEGKSADVYLLAIGSNDMIGPFYMTEGNQKWKDYYAENQVQTYLPNVEDFSECYEKIVDILVGTGKPVILVCPPKVQLEKFNTEQEKEFNAAIKRIAETHNCKVVDMLDIELSFYGETYYNRTVKTYDSFPKATILGVLGMVPVFDATTPSITGLKLTVDGVHSSKKTAKLAGEAITKILESL